MSTNQMLTVRMTEAQRDALVRLVNDANIKGRDCLAIIHLLQALGSASPEQIAHGEEGNGDEARVSQTRPKLDKRRRARPHP